MSAVQRAVVYDCDAERASEVAAVLRFLDIEAMLVDHAALMRSLVQNAGAGYALLIGDVSADSSDAPDWRELGVALRNNCSDLTVVSYGTPTVFEQLTAGSGRDRVLRVPFPFKYGSLAAALTPAANTRIEDHSPVRLPTGSSDAIKEVVGLLRQVAAHDSSVLVLGESGTGKEVAARALHDLSPRRQRPFVAINCGAIPPDLLESELFGHEKGSFTGALTSRKGRFEIAEGGTLFLDEIGDMSMPMQVKLLRVLQERVFERVGGNSPQRCNVRIIAATHRNLEESIKRGAFREDLFYRLNVFPIEMPSLRSRIEDLPLLARDFAKNNVTEGRGRIEFSARAFGALMHYPWPGNVRELSNLVERLSILHPNQVISVGQLPAKYRPVGWVPGMEHEAPLRDAIELESALQTAARESGARESSVREASSTLPSNIAIAATGKFVAIGKSEETPDEVEDGALDELQAMRILAASSAAAETTEALAQLPRAGIDLRTHLYNIERALIRQALERADGTVAQAARMLNLRRTTLVEKLRKFDMLTEDVASEL